MRAFKGSNGRKIEIKSRLHSICMDSIGIEKSIELCFPEEMSMFVNILCAIQRYNAQQNMEFNVENLTLSQGEQTM